MPKKKLSELLEGTNTANTADLQGSDVSSVPIQNADTDTDDEVFFKSKEGDVVELDMDKLRGCKIFFATPCYGGMITDQYFLSMFKTSQVLLQNGIDFRITTLRNESLVPRARNILTAMFLEDEQMTHLFFLDADIEWEPDSVLRALAMNKPIIAGAYPKKTIDWKSVALAAQRGESNIEDFQAEYALNLKFVEKPEEPGKKYLNIKHGAVEVLDASTGFFCIHRKVLDKMIQQYPEYHYNNDTGIDPKFDKFCYAFFDTSIDETDRRYLSEDYTFCRLAQKLGISVWVDPNTNLNHVGTYTFKGNIGRLFNVVTGGI